MFDSFSKIFFTFLLFSTLYGCYTSLATTKIEAIEVRDISPAMGETFYRIYYVDNLVMYENRYRFDSSFTQLKIDSVTQEITGEETLRESIWRSRFFVFHKDSSYGIMYDSLRFYKNRRMPVNYTITNIVGTNRFDSFLTVKPDSVVWNADKTEHRETYILLLGKDMPKGLVVFYYSKKLNHLKNSFNKVVDSVKKMKFFKVEFIFNEFYSEKDKKLWPPTYDLTEMKEINVENPEKIMGYFNKYKESISKVH